LAICQVFDAKESTKLTDEDIAAVPPDMWERARLQPIEPFRLLSFRYPVNAYLQSVRDKSPQPKTRWKYNWVVVYRRNYSVWRLELTRPAYNLLRSLAGGATLGEAITGVIKSSGKGELNLEEQLFHWFQGWISEGIFQSIEF
jgi:hypothetical protein